MIIACGYRKQTGKDSFYQIAKRIYPDKKIVRIAFADPLKDEVYELFLKSFGFEKDIFNDPNKKEIVRPLLQGWGAVRREFFDPLWWVKKAFEKITDPETIYIITDERHLNEMIYIKKMDGYSVHIKRDSGLAEDLHPSETELDSYCHMFEFEIENNGTYEEYEEKVKFVMEQILKHDNDKQAGL